MRYCLNAVTNVEFGRVVHYLSLSAFELENMRILSAMCVCVRVFFFQFVLQVLHVCPFSLTILFHPGTGRMGAGGTCITICTQGEYELLGDEAERAASRECSRAKMQGAKWV